MTDEAPRADRHRTDEPDGTPAFAASLRPVGESLAGGNASAADADDEFAEDTDAGTPPFGRPVLPHESRAGYDVDDASGPTDAARPE